MNLTFHFTPCFGIYFLNVWSFIVTYPDVLLKSKFVFVEHLQNTGSCLKRDEERNAQRICEQAITQLRKLFEDLNTREITPKVLDELSKVGDSMKVKEIAKSFLDTGLFKESLYKETLLALESEFTAYSEFKKRNKKLNHFAHEFQELSKG